MAYLKAFDKEGNLIAVGEQAKGDKGYITLKNLEPHKKYEQGSFTIKWVSGDFETEGEDSPEFMTHDSEYKEFMFYAKDILKVHGLSAYQIAVKNGFTGTEEEWVQSIKGDKGDKMTFEDLSDNDKEELKGEKGDKGEDGVIKNGDVTTEKLGNNAVTPEKTTFFTGGSVVIVDNNILDKETVQTKKTIHTDGSIIEDTSRWLSDFIELDSQNSEQLNFTKGTYRIALYDANKSFISRTGITDNTFYISNPLTKSKYVRLSGTTALDSMMVNKGKELLPPITQVENDSENSEVKIKKEYIPEISEDMLSIINVEVSKNLLNNETILYNKSIDVDGSIIDDKRWLSDFIPLDSDLVERLNFTQNTYRIALYDKDKKFISRTGATNSSSYIPSASSKTKYVRLSSTNDPTQTMVNKGIELLPFEEPYGKRTKIKVEYLPDTKEEVEEPENNNSILDSQLAKIEQNIQTYTPSIPKLEFEEVITGYYEALWLSEDGKRIYGKQGARLWVSYDECKTFTTIIDNTGMSVQAVRELDDGELIFSIERDTVNRTQNGRVFKTKGFDKETGNIDSYELKVETPSTESKINNSWGITSYKNVVTLSEYGLRTEEGARRVWLSTDYGETFKVIFDQKETTKLIEGAPEWTETAHMHTCSFDPYWNRIWIVTGDRPNSATYYSDDFGETWKWVDVQFNNDTMQFTGIIALPNCVIFGSDRAPNGVFVYYRGSKSDTPVIYPLLLVNDKDAISHVFQLPFKRDWDSLTPVYFASPNAGDTDNNGICVATVDGKKAFIIHENNKDEKFGGKCLAFLGNTVQGNIIGTFFDDDISGYRIGKAKAPEWTKM